MKEIKKQIIAFMLPVVILLMFCACGKKETAATPKVEDLISSGYEIGMITVDGENTLHALLQNTETGSYMTFETKVTDEQVETYNNYDVFNDDYQTYYQEFFKEFTDYTVTDITDKVPSQEELDAYVGKTVGDVKADGFEEWGHNWGEGKCFITFDNGTYEADFEIADNHGITDPDSASEDEMNALEITDVSFNGFSLRYFD